MKMGEIPVPLVNTVEMFKKAYEGGYAIGAFNVNNMEIVQGITEACQELKSPVILQVSGGARKYANHTYLTKLVEAAVIETDVPIALQIVIFFVVSICFLVFTRKIFVEKLKTGSEKTNVDALIGEKAIVVQPIQPFAVGQVKVSGQVWSAVGTRPETSIEQGTEVKIHAVEGVKLVVVPVKKD